LTQESGSKQSTKTTTLDNSTDIDYETYTEATTPFELYEDKPAEEDDNNLSLSLYLFLALIAIIIFVLLVILFVGTVYKPYRKLRNQEQKKKEDDFRQKTILALLPAPTL
jgi:heme/copper-type cytochrome/quinol oxidase subunit 2